MKILIIDGTSFFGLRAVEQFLARGDALTVFARGRRRPSFWDRITHLRGDRTHHPAFIEVFRPLTFDVVIDNVAFQPEDVSAAIDAFAGRIGQYILTSTGSVYDFRRRETFRPLREQTPTSVSEVTWNMPSNAEAPRNKGIMLTAVAWVAILVASNFTIIIWRLAVHREAPLWTLAARIGILAILFVLALTLTDLRPLRGYLLALVAGAAGFLLKDFIIQYPPVASWIKAAPWRDAVIVSSSLKLIPALAMAVTVIGLSRQSLFLTMGRLDAPSRLPLLNRTVPWTTLGIVLIFIVGIPIVAYLIAILRPNFQMLQRLAALMPLILIFAAVNAFAEEFVFRSVLLTRLVPAVGGEQALWMTSLRWGLGHWFGTPPGPIGAAGATLFGLFLGKSMLETGGFFWAWLIHATQDVVIFTLLILAAPRI